LDPESQEDRSCSITPPPYDPNCGFFPLGFFLPWAIDLFFLHSDGHKTSNDGDCKRGDTTVTGE